MDFETFAADDRPWTFCLNLSSNSIQHIIVMLWVVME